MKTLVITYLPRKEKSNTAKLVRTFMDHAKGDIEVLDLLKEVPELLDEHSVAAYAKRNYRGEELTDDEALLMEGMDGLTAQLMLADFVVLAFPMYNFSVPASVKAYLDSVMLKGKTWDSNEDGFYGLMKKKKALILMTSGGVYKGKMAHLEHAMSLAKSSFEFMGYKVTCVSASGLSTMPEKAPEIVAKAQEEVVEATRKWY